MTKPEHIHQVICYRYQGKLYESYAQAEGAAVDRFGEELNELLKKAIPDMAYHRAAIKICEAMWAERGKFQALLDCVHQPDEDLERLREYDERP